MASRHRRIMKMLNDNENTCNCGQDPMENNHDSCGCDCGSCSGDDEQGESIITMTDTETGEEYSFYIADDFIFEDEHYCVLVPVENENDPEMVITKVVAMDDGSEGLMSLDDAEYDKVYAEYMRLCEEGTDEDEDDEEDQ